MEDSTSPGGGATGDASERGAALLAVRRDRLAFFLLGGVTLVVCLGGGVVVGVVTGDGTEVGGAWLTAAVIGFPLLVVVLASASLLFLVRWRRGVGSSFFDPFPLVELPTVRERNSLLRAIRRGEPIPPEQHDLAVRVARFMARQTALQWLMVGVAAGAVRPGLRAGRMVEDLVHRLRRRVRAAVRVLAVERTSDACVAGGARRTSLKMT